MGSRAGVDDSGHTRLRDEAALSKCERSSADDGKPERDIPASNIAVPRWAMLWGNSDKPIAPESDNDRESPRHVELLDDMDDPRATRSSASRDRPRRVTPKAVSAGSKFAELCGSSGASKCRESSTETASPVYEQLWGEREGPRFKESGKGREGANLTTPSTRAARPECARLCKKAAKPRCRKSKVGMTAPSLAVLRADDKGPAWLKSNKRRAGSG